MLVGVDIGNAAMIDGEMQPVGRGRSVEKVVRRARMRIARLVIGIAQRAHDPGLEFRRHLIGQHRLAEFEAPGIVGQRFGTGCGR